VADAAKGTTQRIDKAVASRRNPGMPLGVLSNIAREASLGSLLIAFFFVSLSQGADNNGGQGGFESR
jgi:hypothetical protein